MHEDVFRCVSLRVLETAHFPEMNGVIENYGAPANLGRTGPHASVAGVRCKDEVHQCSRQRRVVEDRLPTDSQEPK
jgi:hypothetical protein